MQNINEVHASFFLSYFSALTVPIHQKLVSCYSSAALAVAAGADDWVEKGLLPADARPSLIAEWDKARSFADTEWQEVQDKQVEVYLWQEEDYPPLLKQIAVPPPIIYVMGNGFGAEGVPLALVGSRRPTYYGEKVARQLAGELAERGVITVSGLARGIDSRVHDETIKQGGVTWAVLGSGLFNLYPRENKALAERILESGALISEFPLHAPPFQGHFPRRNRVIAGLSVGTVVIEGDEKSGSLITARLAAEEGREVFAVPGPISSRLSNGPHRLIQNGAALVTGVDDIVRELPDHLRERLNSTTLGGAETTESHSKIQRQLLRELESTALSRDTLAERLTMESSSLAVLLLELELSGRVRSLPGGLVERT